MNFHFLDLFRKPAHTERELIETRTENLFLRDKAEAAVHLAVETGVRNAVLEEQARRSSRPQRERRKDDASIIAARQETTARLSRVSARMRGMGGGR